MARLLAVASIVLAAVPILLGGCTIIGEQGQRTALEQEGSGYRIPHAERVLPVVSARSTLAEVLHYAFLSNANLERAYHEWSVALERVTQDSSLDDPRFSYAYLFSKERMSAWDRSTLGATQMIPFPGKLESAGKAALQQAIAARRRFEDAKFQLQAAVVEAWHELAFKDQSIAIAEADLALLRDFRETTISLLTTGRARQSELTKSDLEVSSAENELKSLRAERQIALARLNALLSREPGTPMNPRAADALTPIPLEDGEVLALAAERNPEILALAAEVGAGENALELARLSYFPDLEVGVSVLGSIERMLMSAITLPLQLPRIRAAIRGAESGVRAAVAAERSHRDDLGAQVILQLVLARDSERQAGFFRDTLLPRAVEVVDATRTSYESGAVSFLELLDTQRALLAIRLQQVKVTATHEQAVARLEALCAIDFSTLGQRP